MTDNSHINSFSPAVGNEATSTHSAQQQHIDTQCRLLYCTAQSTQSTTQYGKTAVRSILEPQRFVAIQELLIVFVYDPKPLRKLIDHNRVQSSSTRRDVLFCFVFFSQHPNKCP